MLFCGWYGQSQSAVNFADSFSLAATYESPKYLTNPAGLYDLLRTATVETTDGIVSILRLSQDGNVTDIEDSIAKLHISEESSRLTIYVPREEEAQELCFCDLLPSQMMDWLMRDPTTQILDNVDSEAVNLMTMIMSVSPSAMGLLLERHGVNEIEMRNEDPVFHREEPPEVPDTQHVENSDFLRDSSTPNPDQLLSRLSQTASRTYAVSNSSAIPEIRPAPIRAIHRHASEDNTQYKRLLDIIIRAARTAGFPSKGVFDMSELNEALLDGNRQEEWDTFDGVEVRGAFRSETQLERDKKIGAVGELYVCFLCIFLCSFSFHSPWLCILHHAG